MPEQMQYAVRDPRTGELVAEYATATDAEVDAALACAASAYTGWARDADVTERAAAMSKVSALVLERADDLAATMVREMGKPLSEAHEEIEFVAAILGYYADNAATLLADRPIDLLAGEGTAVIRPTPVGVLLGVMPWNFPLYQIARFAGPNLVAGNTALLKPAPQCPESSAAFERMVLDAGFPEGCFVSLLASNEQVARVVADPRVQGVSVTGSERAGAAVAEVAGRHLKKVVLELGGSDPFILMSTGDLDATVEAALAARNYNTGQACNAAKRFIVIDGLYDDFVRRYAERLAEAPVDTPLSSEAAARRLAEQVDRAVAQGATFDSTGEAHGAFYPAGVLTGVTRDSDVFHEELFGPVAMMFKVGSEEEAVALANDTPFGLGSYVFTTDAEQAQRIADRIEAGMVFVNGVNADGAELPFGGTKRSGFGRELGTLGIEEFLNKKLIRTIA